MAWHKKLKAGDVVYSGGVRILAKNSASIVIDVRKEELIVYLTDNRSGGHENETESKPNKE